MVKALYFLDLSHFRTANRFPLRLEMLKKAPCPEKVMPQS